MNRSNKVLNLMDKVSSCLESGFYLDTRHAFDRFRERKIIRSEVLYVLKNGYHEKKKDQFDSFYQVWNYAIRGKTVDQRDIRMIVAFDQEGMLTPIQV